MVQMPKNCVTSSVPFMNVRFYFLFWLWYWNAYASCVTMELYITCLWVYFDVTLFLNLKHVQRNFDLIFVWIILLLFGLFDIIYIILLSIIILEKSKHKQKQLPQCNDYTIINIKHNERRKAHNITYLYA